MKLLLTAFLFLFSFATAYAAYNDVTLTTDTVVSIGSDTINVSGSSAVVQSAVVDGTSLTVTLNVAQSGSSVVTLTSPDNKELLVSTEDYTTANDCDTITLTGSSVPASVAVTIGGVCTGRSGESYTSGGGGGGNRTSRPTTPPPAAPPVTPAVPILPAVVPNAVFSATLQTGMTSPDVVRLQTLLASRPDLYPQGTVSGYFGPLTLAAVEKFQVAYGIATPGASGYGVVGPKTRAKLAEVFGGGTAGVSPVATVNPAGSVTAPAQSLSVFSSGGSFGKGASGADIMLIQKILNSDPETRIAESGPGSPGNETELFGSLTESAVQRFQVKYGIAAPGDSGYGWVGPKTRAKLQTF